jgi:hypothetical protein
MRSRERWRTIARFDRDDGARSGRKRGTSGQREVASPNRPIASGIKLDVGSSSLSNQISHHE